MAEQDPWGPMEKWGDALACSILEYFHDLSWGRGTHRRCVRMIIKSVQRCQEIKVIISHWWIQG